MDVLPHSNLDSSGAHMLSQESTNQTDTAKRILHYGSDDDELPDISLNSKTNISRTLGDSSKKDTRTVNTNSDINGSFTGISAQTGGTTNSVTSTDNYKNIAAEDKPMVESSGVSATSTGSDSAGESSFMLRLDTENSEVEDMESTIHEENQNREENIDNGNNTKDDNSDIEDSEVNSNKDSFKINLDKNGSKMNVNNDSNKMNVDDDGNKTNVDNDSSKMNVDNDSSKIGVDNDSSEINVDKDSSKMNTDNDISQISSNGAGSESQSDGARRQLTVKTPILTRLPELTDVKPQLSGGPSSFIDLDEDESHTPKNPGIINLIDRFLQHSKKKTHKHKKDVDIRYVFLRYRF